jgi:hypothetical protein
MAGPQRRDSEIEWEGRRVLAKLDELGGHLMKINRNEYGLVSPALPDTVRVPLAMLHEFHRRGWLRTRGTKPETFVLADPGLFWLRRQRAAGEPFAEQHQILAERLVKGDDGVVRKVTIDEGESPLGWLRHRGAIDLVQFEAGERLRRDFTVAQMTPRMAIDLSAPVVDGVRGARPEAELTERVLAAKQRFGGAMRSAGPVISDLLFDVCCHLIGLEAAESARAWPRRTAKVVLQIGLDRLASHYGLRAVAHHASLRGWRLDDDDAPLRSAG